MSYKTIALIDGSNLYASSKTLNFDIDYMKLYHEWLDHHYDLLRAFYFTAIKDDEEFSSIRPLLDYLEYNNYTVISKPVKEFTDPATGRHKIKGNMDIEIAVHAMELADKIEQVILFSGDGDFRSLVEALQRKAVKVIVVSTIKTEPPMIAAELRRQADEFIDLVDIRSTIARVKR